MLHHLVINIHQTLKRKISMLGRSKFDFEIFFFVILKRILIKFRFFDQSSSLDDEDRSRINLIFNKLVINTVKHER